MAEPLSPIDEMYLEGLEMKRAQLRRAHTAADDAEIEQLSPAWLLDRPMDAPGPIRSM